MILSLKEEINFIMARICFALVILILLSCKNLSEKLVDSELITSSDAQWIQDGRELPASDSLFYLNRPAPLFRKEFNADSEVESAKFYITAAGYYKASMNGLPVGKNILDPAWTDYSKRIYYSEYDVTSLVNEGKNCLGVVLGNGFYNPLPMLKWGHRNLRNDLASVGKPVFIARLIINYKNGGSEEIVTDPSWKYCYGPLLKNSVYLFFSHTIKGQSSNMPMLKTIIDKECTLIDYEKIVDEQGRRLVFFGTQAGYAGMIDTLWALGRRLKVEGIESSLSAVKPAHAYAGLTDAKESLARISRDIRENGLPSEMKPLIVGFAGYGRVSQGAQEIFDIFPFESIEPADLKRFYREGNYSSHRLYKTVFKEEHMVEPISAQAGFDLQDYYDNPARYRSVFEEYLPYLTVFVNCIYWTPSFPRFVTCDYLKRSWDKSGPRIPLRVIGDISCDINGSIECTYRATDTGNPVFIYDPVTNTYHDGFEGNGVVVMSIDNLPAEIPLESSVFFSRSLIPFIPRIAAADFNGGFEDCLLPDPIKKAVVVYKGRLTPDYQYLKEFLDRFGSEMT